MTAAAAKGDRFAVSRIADLRTGPKLPAALADLAACRHAPYAYDADTDRLWLTDAPRAILDAPFLYAAQLDAASEVLAVRPAALLAHGETDWGLAAPLFVLSIGRCGSTMVVRLLSQSGWRGLSEPDVFDLATWDLPAERTDRALRAAAGAWLLFAGSTAERTAFKLRSDLSSHVHVLRRAFPAARFLFLTRAVEPWAHSFVRAFGVRTAHLEGTLHHARACLAHLARTRAPLAVLDYETLAADPNALARALERLGAPPPGPLRMERKHSQADEQVRFGKMTDEKRAQVAAFLATRPAAVVPPDARPFVVR